MLESYNIWQQVLHLTWINLIHLLLNQYLSTYCVCGSIENVEIRKTALGIHKISDQDKKKNATWFSDNLNKT